MNGRFGTFAGVFTPCVLTILGVIMFLRFGNVVGNAGIVQAIGIVLLAKLITTLTSLSLSAIATNTRVRGGGAYFLISRSLGVSFGGSIGVVFFLAQAVSVAMYVVGFTEALLSTFPNVGMSARAIATVVNVLVFACVYIGAGWTLRLQYGVLAVLVVSLVSFFAGAFSSFDTATFSANLGSAYPEGGGFFLAFALFFPAATGIMAGANMSGDLEDPARSIPRGTLLAVLVTGVVYIAMALALGGAADRQELQGRDMVVRTVAMAGWAVTAGVFAATISSALGSMMGAPRILQALAGDNIFGRLRWFAVGSGAANEPRRATLVTFVIAQAGILLGDLDVIAPMITMFFMITYGYLNLATFYESVTRNPSYRPRFRFSHWSTALAGAIGCGAVMVLISPIWAIVAVGATLLLHWRIERQSVLATWGDVGSGVAFGRARRNLLRLEEERYHPKNWRPSILALSGTAWQRVHLAVYGHWLTGGRGLLTLAQVIAGGSEAHIRRRSRQEAALRSFIQDSELRAFPAVIVAPELNLGIEALVQCHGIGAFRSNVVLAGWSADPERQAVFVSVVRGIAELERSIILARVPAAQAEHPWRPPQGTIDVWWRGKSNGHLMLLLAHLLGSNDVWRGRKIRLLRVIGSEAGMDEAREHLSRLAEQARIDAEPVVIVADNAIQAIHTHSAQAAVTFLGFQPPAEGDEHRFVAGIEHLLGGLETVMVVWSAGDTDLGA